MRDRVSARPVTGVTFFMAADYTRASRASSPLPAEVGHCSPLLPGVGFPNGVLVSTTMHELKTPLTAIKGAVEILEQGAGEKADARRKFLGNIRHQTARMIRLVGELRELTRLDTELLRGQKTRVDYAEFVETALERLEPTFDTVHAPCRLDVPEREETIDAMIVPGRIEQVISNILDNAFRYTEPSGEVTVTVRRGEDGTVVTAVRDTGCGITATNIDRVFDRFFTTEPKGQRREYGSGLGLAIARRIVENHGGTIRVESAPGRGACFFFSLPAAFHT